MGTDNGYVSLASIDISVAFQINKKEKAPAWTHGLCGKETRPPEYGVWAGMKARCYNQRVEKYPHYGGRGISVCDGWRDDFAAFYADMGPRPSDDHEIDRKHNDGHYSCGKCAQCIEYGWPANCRWVTHTENLRNQSDNRRLTLNGETLCVMEWAERTGIHRATICDRLDHGWSVEKALTTPKIPLNRCNVKLLTFNGETLSISEWARKIGMKVGTLQRRIWRGVPLEQALKPIR